jgi:hypothetical protein
LAEYREKHEDLELRALSAEMEVGVDAFII